MAREARSGGETLVDELHRVADGLDMFRRIVRNLDVELFFKGHDEFDIVEAVGAQVVDERGLFSDLLRIGVQVLDHDLTDAFECIGHTLLTPCLSDRLQATARRVRTEPVSRAFCLIWPSRFWA